jgi:hypothetical protein
MYLSIAAYSFSLSIWAEIRDNEKKKGGGEFVVWER